MKNLTLAGKLLVLVLLLVASMAGQRYYYASKLEKARADAQAYRNSTNAIGQTLERYKLKNGQMATSAIAAELKLDELARLRSEDAALIKSLRVSAKRVSSVTSVTGEYHQAVTGRLDSTGRMEHRDSTSRIAVRVVHDSVLVDVRKTIGLHLVIHEVPWRFWFIKYGVKARRVEVVPSDSTVTVKTVTISIIRK